MSKPKFIQAKWYTKGPRPAPIGVIVLHTMESPEKPFTAEEVAAWFARGGGGKTSIHYCIDNNSMVQCVKDKDIAWHSGHWPTNERSLSIELAGRAEQTPSQWRDEYSIMELVRAAHLVATWCNEYNIPIVRLTPKQLKAGKRGICGHTDVTIAFDVAGGHMDPRENFPWKMFLDMVKRVRL